MTFEPQVPDWGKQLVGDNLDQLIIYHEWLCDTGIKTGLISPKSKQFVWDEFVVHSLYFGKILSELPGEVDVCLLYTSPSPRDRQKSRMPSSA